MTQTAVMAIYLTIVIVGVAAVVLGIINWIFYGSISSAIRELNDELEKRGREFDSFKSSGSAILQNGNNYGQHQISSEFPQNKPIIKNSIQESEENIPQNIQEEQIIPPPNEVQKAQDISEASEPQIDIVRNVRGEYENPSSGGGIKRETVIMKFSNVQPETVEVNNKTDNPNDEQISAASPEIPSEMNTTTLPVQTEESNTISAESPNEEQFISTAASTETSSFDTSIVSNENIADSSETTKEDIIPASQLMKITTESDSSLAIPKRASLAEEEPLEQTSSPDDDVMDVVSEPPSKNENNIGFDNIHGITVPLYSKAQNDADFKQMASEVQKILNDAVIPVQINIDFTDIYFLYKEETDYLKKIYSTIQGSDCTLGFINCGPELVKILWKDNELGNIILDI